MKVNKEIAKNIAYGMLALTFVLVVLSIVLNTNNKLAHDSSKWAVIKDTNGDQIAFETTNEVYWDVLKRAAGKTKDSNYFAFGKLIYYDNFWGYRIDPVTAYIFNVSDDSTISNIQTISDLADDPSNYLNLDIAIPIENISVFYQKYRYLIFLEIELGIFFALGLTYFLIDGISRYKEEGKFWSLPERKEEIVVETPLEVVRRRRELSEKELELRINELIRKAVNGIDVIEKQVLFPDVIEDEATLNAMDVIEEFVSSKYEFNYGNYVILNEAIDTLKAALVVATARNIIDDLEKYIQIATDILHSFKLEDLID